MTVREVTAEEYSAMAFTHPHVYNSVEFARLNAHKTDGLRYLTFTRNGEPKAGIILGERAGRLLSPFSAPFGGFSTAGQLRLETVEQAVEEVKKSSRHYAKRQLTWFRRNKALHWLTRGPDSPEILEAARQILRENDD